MGSNPVEALKKIFGLKFAIAKIGLISVTGKGELDKSVSSQHMPCLRRLSPQYERQSKMSYRNDAIMAFFFEASKNKDNTIISLASSNN